MTEIPHISAMLLIPNNFSGVLCSLSQKLPEEEIIPSLRIANQNQGEKNSEFYRFCF